MFECQVHYSNDSSHVVNTVTIPTLQLQKMRLGEVKLYAQGHTAMSDDSCHESLYLGAEELHQKSPPGQPVGNPLLANLLAACSGLHQTLVPALTRWPQTGR